MTTDLEPLAAPGTFLGGKYRLDQPLGQGGMGAVFAAENLLLRAPVAIKVLRPEVAQREAYTRRFVQEAQAAAQVRHPNVVSVLDFGYDDATGLLYLVQEFLSGTDLKAYLRTHGPMAPRAAIETLLPVMRALAYAHSRGVVHRDIKPDNIFLCETPEGVVPKVIDFGIAKVFDAEGQSAQRTRTMVVMGTPQYMSPEQACGDRAVDHRTDIWALGVVLYYALTGRFPYEGTTGNIILAKVIQGHPTPIETYWPTIPSDLGALVRGAVAPDLTQRFQTMDAFWDAARRCSVMSDAVPSSPSGGFVPSSPPVAGVSASVTPPSMYAPVQAPPSGAPYVSQYASPPGPETGPPRVTTVPPTQRARRTALWVLGGAVLLVGVVGAVAVREMNRATHEAPAPPTSRETATIVPAVREPVAAPPVAQSPALHPSPTTTAAEAPAVRPVVGAGAVQQVVAPPVAPRSAAGSRGARTVGTRTRTTAVAPTTGRLIAVPVLEVPRSPASTPDAGAPGAQTRRPSTIVR